MSKSYDIFLSHSGAQREFVEELYKEVRRQNGQYSVFFDKDSIIHGESISSTILEYAKTCKLAVAVLSEEYFTRSKSHMQELAAIYKASKNGNGVPCLLPVFLELRVEHVKNFNYQKNWIGRWEEWRRTEIMSKRIHYASRTNKVEPQIWEEALYKLLDTRGPVYLPDEDGNESAVFAKYVARVIVGKLDELSRTKVSYKREYRRAKLEAELHVTDMAYADIPVDFEATKFEVIMACLIASVQGVEAQVAEFSRLHSGKHIQVFNHECDSLFKTLSGTVHDRLRRCNNTLSLVQRWAGVSDPESRIFMSVAFCIVALAELERMFKAVVDLLTLCSKEDWWNTALELSNARPSPTIPRWSSFSLAIRSCEWSMDIVDFGFHALEQFLDGASTVTGVSFKWSDKQSRMVLHIDGKPLNHDEGGSSLLDVTRDSEAKDVTALKRKLEDLNKPRKWTCLKRLSLKADPNMYKIAYALGQKLHGPRPEPNSVPYTFTINPSALKHVQYIGNGSFGCVAEFKWLGHKVSVKMVKSPGLSRKQFEMEAAILATVQHPRVVRMIGCAFEENKETGSLVMELMEGDLRHMIKERCPNPARGVSPFPLVVAIDIMLQIGEGMQYLREHEILHRDLKAQNVLLNRCRTIECGAYGKSPALASLLPEEYYIVKLADFGTAKARREQTNFQTKVGTTFWMAPEVFGVSDAQKFYDWPADVYSFAMTCYEILTGCTPFDEVPNLYKRIVAGERPPLDDVTMPPLLKDLVERCWKTDPKERPDFDEICKTLWQCKVENILPAFRLQMGPSETASVAVKADGECSHA